MIKPLLYTRYRSHIRETRRWSEALRFVDLSFLKTLIGTHTENPAQKLNLTKRNQHFNIPNQKQRNEKLKLLERKRKTFDE